MSICAVTGSKSKSQLISTWSIAKLLSLSEKLLRLGVSVAVGHVNETFEGKEVVDDDFRGREELEPATMAAVASAILFFIV